MCHIFNESTVAVTLLTFIKLSFNETRDELRIGKPLICCLFKLFRKEKLLHRHCFKPCFRICHWESPVSSLRIQNEVETSKSYYVHKNALRGNVYTAKKETVNLLVPIEQPGLE